MGKPDDTLARTGGVHGAGRFPLPAARTRQIPRPRLVTDQASERERPVVVVQAPAGYGKSTFAAEWCRSDDRPVAWLALRDSDNDAVQLLLRLTEALEGLDPVDPALLLDLKTPDPPLEDVLFPRFLDGLPRRGPTLLALDDAQVIEEAPAVAVLRGLANAVPDGSQLLLVSRGIPPVGLARIRAAGDLHEVGTTELAFDDTETRQLFAATGLDLDDEESKELRLLTEGWGAGLAMAAMSRSRSDRAGPRAPRALHHRAIEEYFRQEVLDLQPHDVRQFLLATSVVDRLSGPLCEAMTGQDGGARLLGGLAEDEPVRRACRRPSAMVPVPPPLPGPAPSGATTTGRARRR